MKPSTKVIKLRNNWNLYIQTTSLSSVVYILAYEGDKPGISGRCHYPIKYPDGTVAWDFPEVLPRDIKLKVTSIILKGGE